MSHKEDFASYSSSLRTSSSLPFISFDTQYLLNLFMMLSAEVSFQAVLIHCTSSASNGHVCFLQVFLGISQIVVIPHAGDVFSF
jgi:hypothetical protein